MRCHGRARRPSLAPISLSEDEGNTTERRARPWYRTCRRCVRPLLQARSRTPSRFLPFPPPRSRMPPFLPLKPPPPPVSNAPLSSRAPAPLSPPPPRIPPSRRDTMRLPVRWRRKGPRRRPSFDRRSNERDPGEMADLPHLPRPRPSLKKRKTTDRTNEGPRKRPRKQRGAFDFRRRGVSIYFLQLSLFRPPATTFCNSAYFEPFSKPIANP